MNKVPEGKKLYKLSPAQHMLRLSEFFTVEPKATKESNIIAFSIKLKYDESLSSSDMADWMEAALNEVIRNNDALRLKMVRTCKGMRQYVADHVHYTPERIHVEGDEGMVSFKKAADKYPIDWYDERLFVVKTLILNPHQCSMMLRIHHSVFDGYSIALFIEQFEKAYYIYKEGGTPEPPKRNYSVTEYFDDLIVYKTSEQHKADFKFWAKTYNTQRKYSMPAGRRAGNGGCAERMIDFGGELYQDLVALSKTCSSSMPSLLMTMAALTTYVITGKENFCFSLLSHGQRKYTLRKTIGCMQNTVPIFYDLVKQDSPMTQIIEESYVNYLDTFSHGRLSQGEQLPLSYPEAIKHGFNFNHAWLNFSVMDYQSVYEKSEMEIEDMPMLNQPFQFYASILEVPGEHVKIGLQYQIVKYSAEQVEKFLSVFETICRLVTKNANITPRTLFDQLYTGKRRKRKYN